MHGLAHTQKKSATQAQTRTTHAHKRSHEARLHVRRKHKHKPRVNRDHASTSTNARSFFLRFCVRRPGSHVARGNVLASYVYKTSLNNASAHARNYSQLKLKPKHLQRTQSLTSVHAAKIFFYGFCILVSHETYPKPISNSIFKGTLTFHATHAFMFALLISRIELISCELLQRRL